MALLVRENCFRACSAAVSAVEQKQFGVGRLALAEYFQSLLLEEVEISGIFAGYYVGSRSVGQGSHTVVSDNAQTVEGGEFIIVDTLSLQGFMEEVTAIPVGKTILEDSEIAPERCRFCREESRFHRQLQW